MAIDAVVSTLMFAALLWCLRVQLPSAIRTHDRFAVLSALLTAVLALVTWLFIGVVVRSSTP